MKGTFGANLLSEKAHHCNEPGAKKENELGKERGEGACYVKWERSYCLFLMVVE